MLTPRFKLDQDEKFLHVTIYAPFTHIDKTEVFMDEDEFRFFSKPYYLRLHLPGEVIENDEASATWDAETSSFIVKCPKKTPGEAFSGLEMITELLTPKGEKELKNKIEEIEDNFDKNDNCDSIEEELEELDFYFEQSFPEDENESLTKSDGYGFAFQQFGVYKKLLAEFGEILDITDPDGKSQSERNEVSHEKEQQEFNADHYLSDLFDSVEEINSIISEPCEFSACIIGSDNLSQPININKQSEVLAFSPSEQEAMLALPRSRKIIPPNLLTSVHYSLADILFGYCYIVRVLGNDCPELAWCVSKLSSTLSCVRRHCSARDLMVSSIRRSLCYPLYRNFELAEKVWQDVIIILQIGTPAVLKCLLALIPAFNSSPGKIYIHLKYCLEK